MRALAEEMHVANAAVRVDRNFHLRLAPVGEPGVEVKLSRLAAQQVGQALLEFAGAMVKSRDRGSVTIVAAEHVTQPAAKRKPAVVRLKD